jgi:hypothetical protein
VQLVHKEIKARQVLQEPMELTEHKEFKVKQEHKEQQAQQALSLQEQLLVR